MAASTTRSMSVALVLFILTVFPSLIASHTVHQHVHAHAAPVNTTSPVQTGDAQGNGLPHAVEESKTDKPIKSVEGVLNDRSSHHHHNLHREFHKKRYVRPLRGAARVTRTIVAVAYTTTTPKAVLPATTPTPARLLRGDTFTLSSTPTSVASASKTSTQKVSTSVNPSGTVVILPSLTNKTPGTTGSLHTSLETQGRATRPPIITSSISKPTSLISATSPATVVAPTTKPAMVSANIFANPIATGAPPSVIGSRKDHPVVRQGIIPNGPIGTNKFYANMFLGTQTSPTFLFPYSVAWAKGKGSSASWGLAISHIEASQRVFGNTDSRTGAASYYLNPVGIQSMVISAQELNTTTILTTDSPTAFAATVQLRANAAAAPAVSFPLVQGQAFITAVYTGATPLIQTGVFFKTVTKSTQTVKSGVVKYKFVLNDNTKWILYAYSNTGTALSLQVINDGTAKASAPFYGTIQIAKDPGTAETLYDSACGAYPVGVDLSGSVNGATGSYTLTFSKDGLTNTKLLMFALPHQVASFDSSTGAAVNSGVTLQTTTKGLATAVVADSWTMVETMPVDMSFYPWQPGVGTKAAMTANTRALVRKMAQQELSQDINAQTNLNSVYFSGKALAKFANIILVLNDMIGDMALAQTSLKTLKTAFAVFSSNQQQYPLVYESAWGGVVSTATYVTGNDGADFGNTYYNDHHFHYGYFIYTAAVIGHLDPSWLKANRDWVNTLVRDVANPSSKDPYFPVSRAFDWYHGHSWAHGLYETADGKDQESSSEDVMHAYAIKMWGQVSGDSNMAARGNLMLAILKRALNNYYLYTSTNTVQPAQFIPNKVAGILFENKIDHTTYFGTNLEYIQGIHMLPLLPCTPLVRGAAFVAEEWNAFFSNGRADQIVGGWRGILYGNYATINPAAAFAFFNQTNFDASWLDGGASLTWYLAYSGGLAGL
ncbi:hypothetical protein CONLIGDRAFT_636224 [Coniochaeta ligniaria NRRL 30616]|uniref:glucan endo-1,3-beta-D-glucosidase n=1 Tax=Coniochaeta ligniaria NRRL 30616 TaxID=1408157 RepID=A0A1J7ICF4_9PEZI|nr:hypothetical protein CONLIGDRAFT_636224 [Coniochaeta ligniaria NRRL 30616]